MKRFSERLGGAPPPYNAKNSILGIAIGAAWVDDPGRHSARDFHENRVIAAGA